MTIPQEARKPLDDHYQRALQALGLISRDNLHFVGYFENQDDTLEVALRNLNRFFAQKASVNRGDLVLDVGCGAGGPACYLAETVGCRVVGIDVGESQIEQARTQAETKHVSHLASFVVQDATQMAFASNRFDGALLMGSASNVQRKDDLFAECARVLKDRGRLLLGDAMVVDQEWFSNPRNTLTVRVASAFFGNPFIESLGGYRNLLQRHGFEIVEEQDLAPHVVRSLDLWTSTLEQKKEMFLSQLGDNRYRAFAKGVKIIAQAAHNGPITCSVVTAIRRRRRA